MIYALYYLLIINQFFNINKPKIAKEKVQIAKE